MGQRWPRVTAETEGALATQSGVDSGFDYAGESQESEESREIPLLTPGPPEGEKSRCMDMVGQQKEEQGAQARQGALQEPEGPDAAVGCCVTVFPIKRI